MAPRIVALDIAKLVLAGAVIGIHVEFARDLSPDIGTFLVDFVFRVAVPVFFLTNGYYLARNLAEGRSMGRWAAQVLLIHAVWTALYWPDIQAFSLSTNNPPAWLALLVLQGYFQLWYVPALLIGGLLLAATWRLPLVRVALLAAALYLVGVVLQYLGALQLLPQSLTPGRAYTFVFRNGLFFGFPMMALGALVFRLRDAIPARAGLIATLAGLAIMLGEFGLNRALEITEPFEMGLFVPILPVGIFLLLLRGRVGKVPALLADLPSAIYFTHVLWLTHLFQTVTPSPLRWALALLTSIAMALPLILVNRLLLRRTGLGIL
jgi:surface polysaccharide O-acyltransferase-like enzyme